MITFSVTYIGSGDEELRQPETIEVDAPNTLEAIRRVGPVRNGCIFDVREPDGTVIRGHILQTISFIPDEVTKPEREAA